MGPTRRRSMPAVEAALGFVCAALLLGLCAAGDPVVYFDWDLSYITAAPLGVKQQVGCTFADLPSILPCGVPYDPS